MSDPTAAEVTPDEVAELLAAGAIQLVDVREPYEVAAGAIAGARHLELSRLMAERETLDRDRPVVLYCRVGGRSALATELLRGDGWDARNMVGGILAWDARGLPLAPADGHVADH